jgi:RNA polymerase sigma-70 factor (ECF subfamily)
MPERVRSDPTESVLDSWLVADALSKLTPDHRAVIVRAYYMGQSVAELAAALNVPKGTIRSRMHYGLRALRLVLQERGVTGL